MRANTLDAKALEIDGQGASGGSNPNYIINGNFDIWQRGTSQTTSGYGSVDRWQPYVNGSTFTCSQVAFTVGQSNVPNNPVYFCRMNVTSSAGASNYAIIRQRIEGVETLAGETCTFSFYAKSQSAPIDIATEFKQVFGTGGSPSSQVNTIGVTTHSLSTSWQKFSVTANIPSISGKTLGTAGDDYLEIQFWFDAGSDYNSRTNSLGQQSGIFDIAQCKLEKGSVATPFEPRLIQQELALCQRYYEKSYELDTDPGTASVYEGASMLRQPAATIAATEFPDRFAVEKRAVPTVTWYSPITGTSARIRNYSTSADITVTGTFAAYPPSKTRPGAAYHTGTGSANDLKVGHWVADAEL